MVKSVGFKWEELAPGKVVVQDAEGNIGLLSESEWMEATERTADALVKAVELTKQKTGKNTSSKIVLGWKMK